MPHFVYPFFSVHILQLSIHGHLACFYFLVIMNDALWIFVYKFLCRQCFHSFGHIPGSGISGSMVTLCINIWGTAKSFSKVAVPLYNLWEYESSNFSMSLPTLVTVVLIIVLLVGAKWYLTGVLCQIHDMQILPPILWVFFSLSWQYHLQHKIF